MEDSTYWQFERISSHEREELLTSLIKNTSKRLDLAYRNNIVMQFLLENAKGDLLNQYHCQKIYLYSLKPKNFDIFLWQKILLFVFGYENYLSEQWEMPTPSLFFLTQFILDEKNPDPKNFGYAIQYLDNNFFPRREVEMDIYKGVCSSSREHFLYKLFMIADKENYDPDTKNLAEKMILFGERFLEYTECKMYGTLVRGRQKK